MLSHAPRKLFKSTLNNRLYRNLACVIDKSSRGVKLKRAFEELPQMPSYVHAFDERLTKFASEILTD